MNSLDSAKQDQRHRLDTEKYGAYPYANIGFITSTTNDHGQNGRKSYFTGFLISSSLVLTSAHNLYTIDQNKIYKLEPEDFSLSKDGASFEKIKTIKYKICQKYIELMDELIKKKIQIQQNPTLSRMQQDKIKQQIYELRQRSLRYDYAVIKIDKTVDHQKYFHLNIPRGNQVLNVTVCGYNKIQDKDAEIYISSSQLKITPIGAEYNVHTQKGQSGSPVFEDGHNIVFGIHKGQDKHKNVKLCTLVSEQMTQDILKWTEQFRQQQMNELKKQIKQLKNCIRDLQNYNQFFEKDLMSCFDKKITQIKRQTNNKQHLYVTSKNIQKMLPSNQKNQTLKNRINQIINRNQQLQCQKKHLLFQINIIKMRLNLYYLDQNTLATFLQIQKKSKNNLKIQKSQFKFNQKVQVYYRKIPYYNKQFQYSVIQHEFMTKEHKIHKVQVSVEDYNYGPICSKLRLIINKHQISELNISNFVFYGTWTKQERKQIEEIYQKWKKVNFQSILSVTERILWLTDNNMDITHNIAVFADQLSQFKSLRVLNLKIYQTLYDWKIYDYLALKINQMECLQELTIGIHETQLKNIQANNWSTKIRKEVKVKIYPFQE